MFAQKSAVALSRTLNLHGALCCTWTRGPRHDSDGDKGSITIASAAAAAHPRGLACQSSRRQEQQPGAVLLTGSLTIHRKACPQLRMRRVLGGRRYHDLSHRDEEVPRRVPAGVPGTAEVRRLLRLAPERGDDDPEHSQHRHGVQPEQRRQRRHERHESEHLVDRAVAPLPGGVVGARGEAGGEERGGGRPEAFQRVGPDGRREQ